MSTSEVWSKKKKDAPSSSIDSNEKNAEEGRPHTSYVSLEKPPLWGELSVRRRLRKYTVGRVVRILQCKREVIFWWLPLSACQPDVFSSAASSSLLQISPVWREQSRQEDEKEGKKVLNSTAALLYYWGREKNTAHMYRYTRWKTNMALLLSTGLQQ